MSINIGDGNTAYIKGNLVYGDEEIDSLKKRLAEAEAENQRLREALTDYGVHDQMCPLANLCAGRPTEDGGYEHKIFGAWYPSDNLPKCTCGFDTALTEGK